MFATILLVLAFVLFLISIKFKPPGWDLVSAGLACWVAAQLFGPLLK